MVFKFTIDTITDRWVPANQVGRLPLVVARFLGGHKPTPRHDYWIWAEILISTFCGIALLEGVFKSNTVFRHHHLPMIIASYGAAAILCFNANHVPLAQPRNILVGNVISSIIGVGIEKLFGLTSAGRSHYWASGALSVAVSSVVMTVLNCIHPPAGAAALLPSVDVTIRSMGWWYVPAHVVSSVLMIAVSCITGNIIRTYPQFWWTPKKPQPEPPKSKDPTPQLLSDIVYADTDSVTIGLDHIIVPKGLDLDMVDIETLEEIRSRLKPKESV